MIQLLISQISDGVIVVSLMITSHMIRTHLGLLLRVGVAGGISFLMIVGPMAILRTGPRSAQVTFLEVMVLEKQNRISSSPL